MLRPLSCTALFILFLAVSCSKKQTTEKEEIQYWKRSFIDSSYQILYKDKDTSRALRHFDSSVKRYSNPSAFVKASRYDLKSQYYYFFTADNAATARMIDSSLAMYSTAELQNHYPRSYVGLLLFGGQIAYRLMHYNKANEYYFRAKKLGDTHLSPCERTAFNYNIAMVLFRQENYRASLSYFKEAYALQEMCSPQMTANILQQQEIQSNIGLCYIELKNYDSALLHFDKALEIANTYKDSLGTVFMERIYGVEYGNKARVLMAQHRLDEAEQLSLKSIALNDRQGYEVEFAQGVKLQLAEIYHRKKQYASMFRLLQNMKSQSRFTNTKQRLDWQRLMALYYEQHSQPDSAIHYLKSYVSLNDAQSAEQKNLTQADVTRQMRDKEQLQQISILKKDKALAFVWLCVTVVFVCMMVAIIYLVNQNYRRSKKNLVVLQALNEEIKLQKAAREEEERERHKLITEAVIKAQENERSLIGLELHDNINQVLTTVKLHNEMVLEGIGDPQAILPRTMTYLQDCINEIRSLSKRLSAPTLGKITLEESVKDLVNSINATSKVKITHQIKGLENQILKQELHLGVYRILQEQLNNVLKHADASEVLICLEHQEDRLRLLVADNGKGFVMNKQKSGIGLVNMQTRAENLNGTFEMESQPGKGCKIKVVLPCSRQ